MTDIASYLQGYVAGYWHGYDFFAHEGWSEDEGASAPGPADASSPATAPAPGPLPLRGPLPGARASADSSLPAIHQGALALDVEVQVAGELEAMYVHRGMITALRMMSEVFRAGGMYVAASICDRATKGSDVTVVDQ